MFSVQKFSAGKSIVSQGEDFSSFYVIQEVPLIRPHLPTSDIALTLTVPRRISDFEGK